MSVMSWPATIARPSRVARTGQVATVVMWALMFGSAAINLAGIAPPFAAASGLGYPAYLPRILGVAKLLGCAAFLTPGVPGLREWAYAGFTFELLGAATSHAIVGTGVLHVMAPLFDLAFVWTSYRLWHRRNNFSLARPLHFLLSRTMPRQRTIPASRTIHPGS